MTIPATDLAPGAFTPVYLAWIDIVGDPVRATTWPGGIVIAPGQTGDPALDGQTYAHVPGELVDVSAVEASREEAAQCVIRLAGIKDVNTDLLTALADRTAWQGREAVLWHGVNTGSGFVLARYFAGRISALDKAGDPQAGQTVSLTIKSLRSFLTQARGRTYQDQALYDPNDQIAARIRAAANGAEGAAIGAGTRASGGAATYPSGGPAGAGEVFRADMV